MISFENIPANKLKEFYFLLDQIKYVKYIMAVFEPYKEKFKSKRLKALVTIKEVKKKPKTCQEIRDRIKVESERKGYKYDNSPSKIKDTDPELFPDID